MRLHGVGVGATFASRCGDPLTTQFSTENGRAALARHFDDVEQVDLTTQAVFPDYASAQAYLATFDADLAEALPPFAGERGFAGATTVFSCR